MLNYPFLDTKNTFYFQLYTKKEQLADGLVYNFLKEAATSEDFYFEEAIPTVLEEFFTYDIVYESFDSHVVDFMIENYEYYISYVFSIPQIDPYVKEKDFLKLMHNHMVAKKDFGGTQYELAFLPVGDMHSQGGKEFEEFGAMPAFMLASSEGYSLSLELLGDFLDGVKELNAVIVDYIESKKQGGQACA